MKRTTLLAISVMVALRSFACGGAIYSAHEWGTFTSVQGGDGIQLAWNPFATTDLPSFVYDRNHTAGTGWNLSSYDTKGAMRTLVRMETPVIYFHSAEARTVNVRVDFPQGRVTEWYPQATRLGPALSADPTQKAQLGKSFIEWKDVEVLAPEMVEATVGKPIDDGTGNHYYASRQTGANLIRVTAKGQRKGPELERLLFYRGAGNFAVPLRANLADDDIMRLAAPGGETLKDLFVLTIRRGEARVQYLAEVKGKDGRTVRLSAASFAPLSEARTRLMADMQAALARQGLFADEASAMVNTWKDHWFTEEGTRVLYLLPAAWTDKTLPIDITPRPASLVRVMVGRSEMIMPDVERELTRTIASYQSGNSSVRQKAVASMQNLHLGRFLEPAMQRVVAAKGDKEFTIAAWKLVTEADRAGKASTNPGKQLAAVQR